MIFHVQSTNEKLLKAATIAETVLNDPKFIETIQNRPLKFTHTKDTPKEVVAKMIAHLNKPSTVIVDEYRSFNPWSAAIGYSNGEGEVFINMRKINYNSVLDYVGTFVHEWMHEIGYSHGSNNPKGKENSVPYWVGNLAATYAERFYV
jgi:hypothetical protein